MFDIDELPKLDDCCKYCSLRTGCIILGVICALFSIVCVIGDVVPSLQNYGLQGCGKPHGEKCESKMLAEILVYIDAAHSAIYALCSVLILVGVFTNRVIYLSIFVYVTLIRIFYLFLQFILILFVFKPKVEQCTVPHIYVCIAVFIITGFFMLYFAAVVNSYREKMKEGISVSQAPGTSTQGQGLWSTLMGSGAAKSAKT